MSVGMSKETVTKKATRNFSDAAGEAVSVWIMGEYFDVFCSELAMWRLNDQYPVISKGYSKGYQRWYVSIKHSLPKGFIRE